jgi:hypothetical protein
VSPTPWQQFQQNITFARGMIDGGEAIGQIKAAGLISTGTLIAAHPEDLYRAAWSQSISALDHWLHLEIVARAVTLIRDTGSPRPKRLNNLKVSFTYVDRMRTEERGAVFSEYLAEALHRDSYHSVEAITHGIQLLTDDSKDAIWKKVAAASQMEVDDAKNFHDKAVIARRNDIAHRADLDEAGTRHPMTATEARDTVDWIERLATVLSQYFPTN